MDEEGRALAHKIGLALVKWMDRAGVVITDLHKRTGISRETIYRIRRGETLPSLEILDRIARELGTTAGSLADGKLPAEGTVSYIRRSTDAMPETDPLRQLATRVDALERDLLESSAAQRDLLASVQRLQAALSGARKPQGEA